MAYVSLYRKYRPQTFDDIVGQDHVTTTLAQAISEDHLHHAYLFTGPRGTGKTSTARILAKAVNCEAGPTPTPDNTCTQCRSITDGSSVDVIEIDAASHGGVDDVRELRDRVAFAPASARMKVYIVDECHMLSTAGWNAFLKTVEEPPGHVLFVFATTEPHKVLETILSRTQRFDFKRIGADELGAHLESVGRREGLSFGPGAIDLLVRAGDGSARDTLSVLEQVTAFTGPEVTAHGVTSVLGASADELLIETAELIAAADVAGLCVLVQRLADDGHDLRQFARDAVEHLRALFLLQVAPDAGLVSTTPERLERLREQAGRLGRVELLRAVELLAESQAQMRRGNTRLPLEIALVKAALPEAAGDPAALAARMDRLERRGGVDPAPGPSPAAAAPSEDAAVSAPAPDTAPAAASARAPDPASAAASVPAAPGPDPAPAGAADPGAPPPDPAPPPESAEPAPPRDPSPETAPDGGGHAGVQDTGVDLEFVKRSWPAILDAVKSRSRRLEAFVSPGRPVALDNSVLTLRFGSASRFHAEQCASEEWRQPLQEVLHAVLGARLRLDCDVTDTDDEPDPLGANGADSEAAAVAESEAAEAAGELPDQVEAEQRAIETLTRSLGATLVDDDT